MIKKQPYSLQVINLLITSLYFVSCAHTAKETVLGLDAQSQPYFSRNSLDPILKLNYVDIAPYLEDNGLIWNPFILPTLPEEVISESDFLLGYQTDANSFIFPPQNGSCKTLQKLENLEGKNKKLVSFVSGNPQPEKDVGALFFLLNPSDSKPYAILKLNKNGVSNCYLPNSTYVISYNFSDHRNEFSIQTEEKNNSIFIPFEKKGRLKIEPTAKNNLQNGDLIRIGRKLEINEKEDENKYTLIPTKINNDSFKPSLIQNQNFGVDEYLQSSVLVGNTSFHLELEIGKYVVAVLRKNILICFRTYDVKEKMDISVACAQEKPIDMEDKIISTNDFTITFDNTFYPERLLRDSRFQDWFLSHEDYYLPILNSENMTNSKQNGTYSFLFRTNENKTVKQFPQYFPLNEKDSGEDFSPWGTSLENISKGTTPYTKMTILQYPSSIISKKLFSNSFFTATNGTEIKLFEPFMTEGSLRSGINEQRFRFRISIPSWNSTNVVELSLNNKLYRRWILNREDISQPYSITLDEKTTQDKDFTIRISAWGEEPLPDFIYGTTNEMPYAQTRDYPVKIEGK